MICVSTQMEYECAVISLIYLERLVLVELPNGGFVLNEETYRAAILVCMLMASKVRKAT